MPLTLKQAAEETGLTKPAILKAIQKGKVSAKKNDNGHWRIEPSELFRAYPKDKPVNSGNTHQLTTGNTTVNSGLQVEVEILRERMVDKNEIIEELRKERNDWKQQAQTLLLKKPDSEIVKPPPSEKHKGLFARLFG